MKYYRTLAVIALSYVGSTAQAQTPQLEEIIVWAEFRKTSLQTQSTSTSVVSADSITQRAAQHLEEILNLAPNVNFASGASRSRFYQIRGIGERSQFQEPLNPSIGFVIDGIDFSGLGTAGTLFDVEQVEVLRGPQGTLQGANALAGLINIRTADPTSEPFVKIELGASDYDGWNAGFVSSGPLLTDELLYRLSLNTLRSDGFIENDFLGKDDTNNRDETTIRGKLRWLPSEAHSVDLTAMYVDIDNGYDAFSLDSNRHTLSDEPGQDIQETSALSIVWTSHADKLDFETTVTTASTETDYGYDEDWTFVGIAPALEYSSTDQYLRDRDSYSAEVRALSNEQSKVFGNSSDWVLGLYYLGDREDLRRRYTFYARDFESSYDTDTYAIFGQLDSQLSEQLTLITGLRLENRQTEYSDNNAVDTDLDRSLWGGKLVLEYTIDNNRMAYAGVSRGYRAYGVNAQILASINSTDDPDIRKQLRGVQDYDDEHLLNYEVGYKASYLEDRLRSRLAIFYMDRQDQQLKGSFLIQRDDGSTAFIDYTNNTAKGNNYGLELELEWQATEDLNLYANLGLLETEFEDYITADGLDLSGREQAHAPAYQYALGGRYNLGGGFYIRADFEGKDDYFVSDSHNSKAPSHNLLHMRAGYMTQQWSVAVWARNLTDEDYFVRGFRFPNDPRKGYITESYYQFGDPRVAGVSLSYSF